MYDDIIQTAFLTAYPRTFTDIPYAKQIFSELEKLEREEDRVIIPDDMRIARLAPEIEARYKLTDKLLGQNGATQILELASGFSTRGIVLTENKELTYAELELPDMAELKQTLITRLGVRHPNWQMTAGNALEYEDLLRASEKFDSGPVAILNEGLMRYLDFTEKAKLARAIHKILRQRGGVWITPDMTLKKLLETQNAVTMPGVNDRLEVMTKRNVAAHSFDDESQAICFFEEQGFDVEVHRGSEVAHLLTSPSALNIDAGTTMQIIAPVRVMVLRLTAGNN